MKYNPFFGKKQIEFIEDEQKLVNGIESEPDFWYTWQCVTLLDGYTTIDLVIKDKTQMLALLGVLHHHVNKVPTEDTLLRPFYWLRFRMRIGFIAFSHNLSIVALFKYAIQTTLHQLKQISLHLVKSMHDKEN